MTRDCQQDSIQPPRTLNRVIFEVTNRCNLDCEICVRKTWSNVQGSMPRGLFHKGLEDIKEFSPLPLVFFGGYGEPLLHPDIMEMIRSARGAGAQTGLVTNGILLSAEKSRALIHSGLTRLWVSLDSAHKDSYQCLQEGDYRQTIFQQLEVLLDLNKNIRLSRTNPDGLEIGLALVLTKNNAPEIKQVIKRGKSLGIESYFFTNLEAYSEEMAAETPYPAGGTAGRGHLPEIHTNLVNSLEGTAGVLQVPGSVLDPAAACPFAEKGELVVRWDGEVSPCLPLLYDHTSILGSWKRQVYSHSLGNIAASSLGEIWNGEGYQRLRDRLLGSKFSPCASCRDCWLSDDNLLDCMGYEHPTCGGCLWAQGLIRCP